MRLFIILFLLVSLRSFAQAETIFTVSKAATDSSKKNATQADFVWFYDLPPGAELVSCDVYIVSSGEVFKLHYVKNNASELNTLTSFINRLKPKDKISFENIWVIKDGVKIRIPDKTTEMR